MTYFFITVKKLKWMFLCDCNILLFSCILHRHESKKKHTISGSTCSFRSLKSLTKIAAELKIQLHKNWTYQHIYISPKMLIYHDGDAFNVVNFDFILSSHIILKKFQFNLLIIPIHMYMVSSLSLHRHFHRLCIK